MRIMRTVTLLLAVIVAVGITICGRSRPSLHAASLNLVSPASGSKIAAKPDFATQIKPIFEARCQPCHFQGGRVYDRMPFDRPETITRLGTKLFTRIKDEKEQRLIREFLGQP